MTPETINALVNMGSAGAVIAVVILFLKSNEKRDAEWRNFFMALNQGNKDDMTKVSVSLDRLIEAVRCMSDNLQEHDSHVDERVKAVQAAARRKVGSD